MKNKLKKYFNWKKITMILAITIVILGMLGSSLGFLIY